MKEEISTKEKILAAAKTLFVTNGFAGTSMGNIAKLAEVNHSLIFHHYKNKEQLWLAVKQDIVRRSNNEAEKFDFEGLTWEECLRELFKRNLSFYRNNTDLIRMLNWQRLEKESNHQIGITQSADMENWVKLIRSYQVKGAVNKKYKPEWIVTLILSIISSTALDPNIFINEEKEYKNYIDFCIDILNKALEK